MGIGAASVVGFLILGALLKASERSDPILLDEDFDSGEPGFSTDSDSKVDLLVVDGKYRILIKDPSSPQMMRHFFDPSLGALRFEATITVDGNDAGWLAAVGCWTGSSAYQFGITDGRVGLFETVNEETGQRQVLSRFVMTEALKPAAGRTV